MQALILAAGRGSRLASVVRGPKCLTTMEGVPLIEYQLAVLRHLGITEVGVVVGYRADDIRRTLGDRCHYIVNERYAETNSLYSLWLARHWTRASFLLSNADVLAHPQIYWRLLAQPGSALAYDSNSGDEDEHMKVFFEKGRLQKIRKSLPAAASHGESIGVLKFDASAGRAFFRSVEQALALGGENQWAPAAVELFARSRPVAGVDIAGLPWCEIDFPDDLTHARRAVWPAVPRSFAARLPGHLRAVPSAGRKHVILTGVAA